MASKTMKRRTGGASSRQAPSEFDREFVLDTFRAPSREARRKWERVRRKPGRPRKGQGVKVISVSVERGLLAQADLLAKKKGVTRAALISMGLRAMVAAMD
jgi:hypothetical protein